MECNAKAHGRKGNVREACGRLDLKAEDAPEARMLAALHQEFFRGDMSVWIALVWAKQNNKLPSVAVDQIDAIEKFIRPQFQEFLQGNS